MELIWINLELIWINLDLFFNEFGFVMNYGISFDLFGFFLVKSGHFLINFDIFFDKFGEKQIPRSVPNMGWIQHWGGWGG